MRKNNGGPAFACASNHWHQGGMSLRDWFAGMALQGICANPNTIMKDLDSGTKFVTEIAYFIADAMLAERATDD